MGNADLRKVDIGLLLALDALLRLRNVSQAARSLGISQPALSARLSRLRIMFDDRLFVTSTSGRGLAPTPRAQTLQEPLSDAIAKLQLVLSPPDAFEAARSERQFVIGLHRNPSAMLGPDLIPRVQKEAPHVRLAFVWPASEAILGQLESGAIDIVLGSELPMHGDLIARTLLEEATPEDAPRSRSRVSAACRTSSSLRPMRRSPMSSIDTSPHSGDRDTWWRRSRASLSFPR